ncbi:putative beta-lactamase [Colletotrichum sublineola]|uniref:Putative beta-lactamase n=1 Tax=Colletotrichum sublineola TaxID=1173701 RepID=A0A066XUC5_COLSU|nr:putative beta-lactamase [Colletotrichum sublineola]
MGCVCGSVHAFDNLHGGFASLPDRDATALDATNDYMAHDIRMVVVPMATVADVNLSLQTPTGQGVERQQSLLIMALSSIFNDLEVTLEDIVTTAWTAPGMQRYEGVGKLLLEDGEMKVLEGFKDGEQLVLRNPIGAIALRLLLAHTSCISYIVEDANLIQYRDLSLIPEPGARTVAKRSDYPLIRDPGQRWSYGPTLEWAGKLNDPGALQQRLDMLSRRTDVSRRNANGFPRNEDASTAACRTH